MTATTIKGFAEQIGVPPETLLRQLVAAGISEKQAEDVLSDDEKMKLLGFLRGNHGMVEEGAV